MSDETRAAISGGLASAPFVVGLCGFGAHWNAYTNLFLILASGVLWLTLRALMREKRRLSAAVPESSE